MGALETMRAGPEPRVDPNVVIAIVEPKLPTYIRWSGVKSFHPMLNTLLEMAKALPALAELWIRVQQCGLAMTTR